MQALVDPWQCRSNWEETRAWQWLICAWKKAEMEPYSRAAHAAAVNQSHSWLQRACASAVTGPGASRGPGSSVVCRPANPPEHTLLRDGAGAKSLWWLHVSFPTDAAFLNA